MRYTKTNKNYGPIEPITNSKTMCQNHRVEEINSSQLTQKVLEESGFCSELRKSTKSKSMQKKEHQEKKAEKNSTRG